MTKQTPQKRMARLVPHEFGSRYTQALRLVINARELGIIDRIGYPEDREAALETLKEHYSFEESDASDVASATGA